MTGLPPVDTIPVSDGEEMTSAPKARATDPLRHLDENKVLEALRLVRRGQVIPLNLRLDGPPVIRGGRPPLIRTVQKHNETRPAPTGRPSS